MGKTPEDPNAALKRTLVIVILLVLAFTTMVVIFTRVGRGVANSDPFLDPRANPNIRVKDSDEWTDVIANDILFSVRRLSYSKNDNLVLFLIL